MQETDPKRVPTAPKFHWPGQILSGKHDGSKLALQYRAASNQRRQFTRRRPLQNVGNGNGFIKGY